MENLTFILTCLAIFAAIMLVAAFLQKKLCRDIKAFSGTHYITYTAIFAAMAGVLMLVEIPLPFAPPFYKIDLSELPILICTFYLGPVAGVTAELVKVLVKLLLKGTTTAFVGDFANFAVGCSFVLPASLVYHARPGRKSALIGLVVGTLCMTVFGSAFNAVYLLPKFAALYGMPMEAISTLVLFAVVPFNLLKGAVVSLLTFLLYKRISPLLHKGDARRAERKAKKA